MSTQFARWLSDQLRRDGMNYTELAKAMGTRPNTARSWALAENQPSRANVVRLARHFHADLGRLHELLGWLPRRDSEPEQDIDVARVACKLAELTKADLRLIENLADELLTRQCAR